MRSTKWVALGVLLVAAALAAACGSGGSGYNTDTGTSGTSGGTTGGDTGTGTNSVGVANNTVVAHNFAFTPSTLEVNVGDTVTWSNGDDAAHDIEIDGKNLGRMSHGETLTWTPDKAGTFPYSCTIHPSMTGTIVVK